MEPKLGGREVEGAAYGLTLLLASQGLSKCTLLWTTAGPRIVPHGCHGVGDQAGVLCYGPLLGHGQPPYGRHRVETKQVYSALDYFWAADSLLMAPMVQEWETKQG